MSLNLDDLVERLRTAGGDSDVDVKSAADGLPQSLTSTLSALANLPGGGTIILGLDEATGFRPVPVTDPQKLKQGIAAKAPGTSEAMCCRGVSPHGHKPFAHVGVRNHLGLHESFLRCCASSSA